MSIRSYDDEESTMERELRQALETMQQVHAADMQRMQQQISDVMLHVNHQRLLQRHFVKGPRVNRTSTKKVPTPNDFVALTQIVDDQILAIDGLSTRVLALESSVALLTNSLAALAINSGFLHAGNFPTLAPVPTNPTSVTTVPAPTGIDTHVPSLKPTDSPTKTTATLVPTPNANGNITDAPTASNAAPSKTKKPTGIGTHLPSTQKPTIAATAAPSTKTHAPTKNGTHIDTHVPSSSKPTIKPIDTRAPTHKPTRPAKAPAKVPHAAPSLAPH
jgi:hypothetical protein